MSPSNNSIVVRPTLSLLLDALPSDDVACAVCSRKFANRSARRWHETRSHPNAEARQAEWRALNEQFGALDGDASTKFACPLAECEAKRRQFASAKLLVQHYQKTHMEKCHRCVNCPARFALRRDLNYHMKKVCPATRQRENDLKSTVLVTENMATIKNKQMNTVGEKEKLSAKVANKANNFSMTANRFCFIQPRPMRKTYKSTSVQTELSVTAELPSVAASSREMISVGTTVDYRYMTADVGCGPSTSYYDSYSMEPATTVICDDGNVRNVDFDYYSTTGYHIGQASASTATESTYRQDSFAQTVYPQTVDFGTQYSMAMTFVGMPAYEYAATKDGLL